MASRRVALRVGLSVPLAARLRGPAQALPLDRFGARLGRLFRHPAVAEAVGGRLKRSLLPESRLATVVAALRRGHGDLPPVPDDEDEASLRAALGARVRADFRAGRTLWFEGWLLAETEARLLLIAHLAVAP